MVMPEIVNATKYEKVATNENRTANEIPTELGYGYGYRHVQVLLMFFCICINFIARAQLSATIVAMSDISKNVDNISAIINKTITNVNQSESYYLKNEVDPSIRTIYEETKEISNIAKELDKNATHDYTFYNKFMKGNTTLIMDMNNLGIDNESDVKTIESVWNVYRTYKWPKAYQEMCLGAFFLGYFIMMFPMGMVVQRWGGKIGLQIGLSVTGIVTFVTPWLVAWGEWKALSASRVVIGMFQSGTYPGIHTLLARWVPVSERARLGTCVYTGTVVGIMLAFQISGFLAASRFGWPSMFWVSGILCMIMAIIMTIFGTDSPQRHRSITDEERNFIMGKVFCGVEKRLNAPWQEIFTSRPLWVTFFTQAGTENFPFFCLTQVPTYLRYILNVDIKNSGLLSSIPYVVNFITIIMFGQLSDYGINHRIVTRRQARMISNTVANVFPAMIFTALTFTSSTVLGVSLLVLAMATNASSHTGWMMNYIDLAPNFSGTLIAMGNTVMNVSYLLIPTFISRVVTDVSNPVQWRIVLLSIAAFGLVCNGVYMVFMSTDEQPWNKPQYQDADQEDVLEKQKKHIKNDN